MYNFVRACRENREGVVFTGSNSLRGTGLAPRGSHTVGLVACGRRDRKCQPPLPARPPGSVPADSAADVPRPSPLPADRGDVQKLLHVEKQRVAKSRDTVT